MKKILFMINSMGVGGAEKSILPQHSAATKLVRMSWAWMTSG